ncbi:putative disease resistance protein [Vitis vinifera]|uniref:Putative disease resistance protein n=1 Tax=Vitis vinifera TaxID=29760 RepID=A0A438HUI3_VITVI|nr:putative disease resistance protein [Vitis vinifera]
MEEIVVTIAAKVAEYLVAPIGRSFGYLFNYRSNIDDLRQQVEKLGDARARLERSVDEAIRNGDEIEADVDKWLLRVSGFMEEAGKFFEVEKKANQSCFNGSCPNLKSQYQLSREAKKRARVVAEIQGDGKFERVSYRAPLPGIGSAPFKGHEALESRMTTLDEIMEALRDAHVNIIGVWGMAGVGKTTLMKQVAKQVEEEKLFDKVVMAYISSTPELKKIQGELADMLGLKFEEESEMGRAARLCERLKKVKKILIILDDIWTELDLEKVGIPFGDDHKGCKMVLTSRNKHVLSNEMGTQKDFPVEHLQEEEALILFKKMAGDSIEEPDLQSIAIDVAKECAGLPIAIVTVAKALKNKGLSIWEDALRQLKRSIPTNIKGMDAMVYSTLELSYNHLEGTNTLEEAKNRIDTLVDSLKASKLLLDTGHNSFVRMHDVVRDVAIAIVSKVHCVFSLREDELAEWPKMDELQTCTKMSLAYNDICELPIELLNKLDTSLRLADGISLLLKGAKDLHLRELSGAANVFPKLDREGSFSYLRIVKVEHCDGLKFLFSMSMARGLSRLEKIEITRCKNMYKMVAQGKEDGDDAVDAILFAELRYLTLQHLPKLRNFCLKGKQCLPPRRGHQQLMRVGMVNSYFPSATSSPEDKNCASLLKVLPPSLLQNLQNLEVLIVENCKQFEEVFDLEDDIPVAVLFNEKMEGHLITNQSPGTENFDFNGIDSIDGNFISNILNISEKMK